MQNSSFGCSALTVVTDIEHKCVSRQARRASHHKTCKVLSTSAIWTQQPSCCYRSTASLYCTQHSTVLTGLMSNTPYIAVWLARVIAWEMPTVPGCWGIFFCWSVACVCSSSKCLTLHSHYSIFENSPVGVRGICNWGFLWVNWETELQKPSAKSPVWLQKTRGRAKTRWWEDTVVGRC